MTLALEEANAAAMRDEVPIGAVVVDPRNGGVIGAAGNRTREFCDPTAHAEVLAIRSACEWIAAQRIPEFDLYVTLEPCTMCAGAISFARIRRLILGAPDPKGGGILHGAKFYTQPTCHWKPEVVTGVMEQECGDVLRSFFKTKRKA